MKRNSTITSNSSSTNPTAPISFAAAAQKNTTKTPAAAPTPTPPQQQSSQQPPSAPQAAAPQQTPPRQSPVKPSTANGNYSSVAAKANANAYVHNILPHVTHNFLLVFSHGTHHDSIFSLMFKQKSMVMKEMTMVCVGHRHHAPCFFLRFRFIEKIFSPKSTLIYSDHIFQDHRKTSQNCNNAPSRNQRTSQE